MADTREKPAAPVTERTDVPRPIPVAVTPPRTAQTPAAAPAEPPERDPKSPYTGPSEMVPGGRFIDGAKLVRGKLMGGRVKDANGKTLATFKDDQENTGVVEDGTPPENDEG